MRNITHQMAVSAINGLDNRFDAHMIEKRILRVHPAAIARELLWFDGRTVDPLKQFSAHFARWIDREFRQRTGQITKTQKVSSYNLAGDSIRNQEWQRINSGTPVI
jgi:hypothetical protein